MSDEVRLSFDCYWILLASIRLDHTSQEDFFKGLPDLDCGFCRSTSEELDLYHGRCELLQGNNSQRMLT